MEEQPLEVWVAIASAIGVFIGGACTIFGSYIASSKQVNAQKEIFSDEITERYSQQRTELKLALLADFMGHRNALVGHLFGMGSANGIADNTIFFSSLNKIGVIFSDSPQVLESYNEFRRIIIQKDKSREGRAIASTDKEITESFESRHTSDNALFQLAFDMHEDLNIPAPDKDAFLKPLRV